MATPINNVVCACLQLNTAAHHHKYIPPHQGCTEVAFATSGSHHPFLRLEARNLNLILGTYKTYFTCSSTTNLDAHSGGLPTSVLSSYQAADMRQGRSAPPKGSPPTVGYQKKNKETTGKPHKLNTREKNARQKTALAACACDGPWVAKLQKMIRERERCLDNAFIYPHKHL